MRQNCLQIVCAPNHENIECTKAVVARYVFNENCQSYDYKFSVTRRIMLDRKTNVIITFNAFLALANNYALSTVPKEMTCIVPNFFLSHYSKIFLTRSKND